MTEPARLTHAERDLLRSVAVLALIVGIAEVGMAFDGNWPKVLRVGVAFSAYAGVLLGNLWGRRASGRPLERLPLAWFVWAGLAAGVTSGLVRPDTSVGIIVAGALGAALLFGVVHRTAILRWRDVRRATTGEPGP